MPEIKVKEYVGSQIRTEFAGEGLWRLAQPVACSVYTTEGTLRYFFAAGFPTDMRSGCAAINSIIPKFTGNNRYNLAILCHDFAYTKNAQGEHFVSRLLADQLLREMTRESGTLNALQRALMYRALRLFGGSAYESENEGAYAGAEKLIKFRWEA